MSMGHTIIGAAVGFILAQGLLFGARHVLTWLKSETVQEWLREVLPSQRFAAIGGFGRYAALVLGSAALITLGLWGVVDYLAARSERNTAMAATFDPATTPTTSESPTSTDTPPGTTASLLPKPTVTQAAAVTDAVDPYADPDFKVHHKTHKAGSAQSLKETLVQREEAKAGSDLLKETAQHAQRSQYDCEVADHANRYLKAGLDVWGFTAWQGKYFPTEGYKGASLPECKDIQSLLDPSPIDLKSAVAQQK
jgi:hypothetical protein